MSKIGLYPFVSKLFSLVSANENAPYVSWESSSRFIVWNPSEFSTNVLPKYFKHNNFCSFVRQLNIYGFHKAETDNWIFEHEDGHFQKDHPELLEKIQRRTQKRTNSQIDGTPKKILKKEEDEKMPKEYFNPIQNVDEINHLKAMNDFLYAEVDSVKKKSQSQQATINWLINEFRKAKEEIDLLKSFQQLSIDINDNKDINKNDLNSSRNQVIQPQHVPNNLYLTNEVYMQDYSIQTPFIPMNDSDSTSTYTPNSNGLLYFQEPVSPDLLSTDGYSINTTEPDYEYHINTKQGQTNTEKQQIFNTPIDFGLYN